MSTCRSVSLPVCILDNEFRDPDIDQHLETLAMYEPDVAILGDAYTADEAVALAETIDVPTYDSGRGTEV